MADISKEMIRRALRDLLDRDREVGAANLLGLADQIWSTSPILLENPEKSIIFIHISFLAIP